MGYSFNLPGNRHFTKTELLTVLSTLLLSTHPLKLFSVLSDNPEKNTDITVIITPIMSDPYRENPLYQTDSRLLAWGGGVRASRGRISKKFNKTRCPTDIPVESSAGLFVFEPAARLSI